MKIRKRLSLTLAVCLLFCGLFTGQAYAGAADTVSEPSAPDAQAVGNTVLVIRDLNTGRLKGSYTVQDFLNREFDSRFPQENGHTGKLVFQKFSGTSNTVSGTFNEWYGAVGITVEDILREQGVWTTFSTVVLRSDDASSYIIKAEDLKNRTEYYYENSQSVKTQVYPMISLWYTESGQDNFVDPPVPGYGSVIREEAPRFFCGQSFWQEDNRGNFLKNCTTIYVDFPPDELHSVPPVISGVPTDQSVKAGSQYQYPSGITAKDAYGNAVTVTRSVANEDGTRNYVDTALPGTYTVTYKAVDNRGNVSEKSFRVFVYENDLQPGVYGVTIQPSDDYSVSTGTDSKEPAKLTSIRDGENKISFTVSIAPERRYGKTQTVIFAHYRGNKLMGLSSQTANVNDTKKMTGSFRMQKGDVMKVMVTDQLDSIAGSRSCILNK